MNCEDMKNNLDAICQSVTKSDKVEKHIAHCSQCEDIVEEHQQYLKAMKNFQTPELEIGQAAKLLADAKKAQTKPAEFGFFKGFAAASMMFVALFSSWHVLQNDAPQVMQIVSAEGLSTDVTIVIYVPEDMPNADLQITLPDNVQLAGLSNLSTISWPVDLKAGANTLSLPIDIGEGVNLAESLRFMASINYNDKNKEFEVNVNLTAPQNQAQHKALTSRLPLITAA